MIDTAALNEIDGLDETERRVFLACYRADKKFSHWQIPETALVTGVSERRFREILDELCAEPTRYFFETARTYWKVTGIGAEIAQRVANRIAASWSEEEKEFWRPIMTAR